MMATCHCRSFLERRFLLVQLLPSKWKSTAKRRSRCVVVDPFGRINESNNSTQSRHSTFLLSRSIYTWLFTWTNFGVDAIKDTSSRSNRSFPLNPHAVSLTLHSYIANEMTIVNQLRLERLSQSQSYFFVYIWCWVLSRASSIRVCLLD